MDNNQIQLTLAHKKLDRGKNSRPKRGHQSRSRENKNKEKKLFLNMTLIFRRA